jgi:hypothetical protein
MAEPSDQLERARFLTEPQIDAVRGGELLRPLDRVSPTAAGHVRRLATHHGEHERVPRIRCGLINENIAIDGTAHTDHIGACALKLHQNSRKLS